MSNIEWTDETWNPVTGCDKVSPGCKNCYAEAVADRFWAAQYPKVDEIPGSDLGRPRIFTDVRCHPERLGQPLRWRKPRRVFVNSMSDLFHDAVPDEFIDQACAVMSIAERHTFQVLTKRPGRMREYFGSSETIARVAEWLARLTDGIKGIERSWSHVDDGMHGIVIPNVWLGVSVEDQKRADERIPMLLQTPAAVRFLSCEPLLGPIDLRECAQREDWHVDALDTPDPGRRVSWVIVGGESGPKARPCDVAWIRRIVEQCRDVGVPVFVKQLGSRPFYGGVDCGYPNEHFRAHGVSVRDRKGGNPDEWPEDLRVRQYPEG